MGLIAGTEAQSGVRIRELALKDSFLAAEVISVLECLGIHRWLVCVYKKVYIYQLGRESKGPSLS